MANKTYKGQHTAIPGGGTGKNSAYMFKKADGKYEAVNVEGGKYGKAKTLNTESVNKELVGTAEDASLASGTSIFDPVVCEAAYTWFCPPGGTVLDPFAGGSVRGIVASKLGLNYVGVDLSARQIEANCAQGALLCEDNPPRWINGNSLEIEALAGVAVGQGADLVFSCPPYADLEVYSDDPRDLSYMDYAQFRDVYAQIIAASLRLLKPNRFACFVIGEVRDKKTGFYYGFVPDTINAFVAGGAGYYNEIILETAIGSLPIRAGKQFQATRKIGKTHQNILVFCKGDPRKAADACGELR